MTVEIMTGPTPLTELTVAEKVSGTNGVVHGVSRNFPQEHKKVPPTLLLTAASYAGRFVAQGDTK